MPPAIDLRRPRPAPAVGEDLAALQEADKGKDQKLESQQKQLEDQQKMIEVMRGEFQAVRQSAVAAERDAAAARLLASFDRQDPGARGDSDFDPAGVSGAAHAWCPSSPALQRT